MVDDTSAREEMHEEEADAAEPAPPRPSDDVAAALVDRFEGVVFRESHGQPVVYVTREQWRDVLVALRDEHDFAMALDVCAVDHLTSAERIDVPGVAPERFEVVANLISHSTRRRMRVVAQVPVDDPVMPSAIDVYPGLTFAERETWDLFGIDFDGHDDLARILMPDDWIGHPLRKDDAPARVPVTFKGDPAPR